MTKTSQQTVIQTTMQTVMQTKYKHTLKVFWFLYFALLAIYCAEKLILSEHIERIQVILLSIQLVPLLAFLPMLLKPTARTFQWFCFVLLLYFMVAVLNAFTPDMEILGTVQSIIISSLFISAMMLGRWKMRFTD